MRLPSLVQIDRTFMLRLLSPRISSAACVALLVTAACGKKHTSASAPRGTPRPSAARVAPGTTQVGLASWYGEPYHGRRAANGEVYDMNQLTAAHRTLPFDTILDVLNLENKLKVQVRINDRGPFVGDRIIDLSRAAAQQISMIGPGIAKVKLEVIGTRAKLKAPTQAPASVPAPESGPAPMPESAPVPLPGPATPTDAAVITSTARPPEAARKPTGYAVQVGAFSESKAAEKLQRRMALRYGSAYIEYVRSDKGLLYRVRVGPKSTLAEAAQVAASLKQENFESLVVQVPIQDQGAIEN